MSAGDHRPDLYGRVEATWRTAGPPPDVLHHALAITCPDCNVNVFIYEDDEQDGVFHTVVAHDETCPWLTAHKAGES